MTVGPVSSHFSSCVCVEGAGLNASASAGGDNDGVEGCQCPGVVRGESSNAPACVLDIPGLVGLDRLLGRLEYGSRLIELLSRSDVFLDQLLLAPQVGFGCRERCISRPVTWPISASYRLWSDPGT